MLFRILLQITLKFMILDAISNNITNVIFINNNNLMIKDVISNITTNSI